MPIHLFGAGAGDAPFNRTFFNATLGDVIERAGPSKSKKVSLFLVDGSVLDMCSIDSLSDSYMTVRAYRGKDEPCDTTLHLIPYGAIYRVEISAADEEKTERVGFQWTPGR